MQICFQSTFKNRQTIRWSLYCINAAWHGDNQSVALLRCNEAQAALIAVFRSSALLGLVSLIFLLTILHRFSMRFGSRIMKMSERGDSWCTDSSFSSLLVKLSQVFESALLDRILKLAVITVACAHFPPISSFQSTLHLICFDTALLEQPPLSVMTLCDLLSLWRVSMIVFWTIAKSTVFPIIVLSKNKRYSQFILYGWSFIETQM